MKKSNLKASEGTMTDNTQDYADNTSRISNSKTAKRAKLKIHVSVQMDRPVEQ